MRLPGVTPSSSCSLVKDRLSPSRRVASVTITRSRTAPWMTGSSPFSAGMYAEPGLDDRREQERPAAGQRAGRQDGRGCLPCAAGTGDHEPDSEDERRPVPSEGGGKDVS